MVIAGVGDHTRVSAMADGARVPVVNARSSLLDPLQTLAYFFTIQVGGDGRMMAMIIMSDDDGDSNSDDKEEIG